MIEIPLSKQGKHAGKYVAIVSDEDADLAKMRWAAINGRNGTKYAARHAKDKTRKIKMMHRDILERVLAREIQVDEYVDHVNGNGLDNRRENLRLATNAQNQANRGKNSNNKSGYKGVCWDKKASKWVAKIWVSNTSKFIGYFDTPEEAHDAYKAKAIEIFGEFAKWE